MWFSMRIHADTVFVLCTNPLPKYKVQNSMANLARPGHRTVLRSLELTMLRKRNILTVLTKQERRKQTAQNSAAKHGTEWQHKGYVLTLLTKQDAQTRLAEECCEAWFRP